MDLGYLITSIFGAMGSAVGFLQDLTISFLGFTFSMWDFLVGFFVLVLVLRFIFPWFEDESEEM